MNWGLMEILPPSSFFSNSPNFLIEEDNDDDDARGGGSARWTAAQNKMFENALAFFDEDTPDRWQCVAAMVPGKTVGDVIRQYKELEDDVSSIEAGLTPIPGYGYGGTLPMFSLDWRCRKCTGSGRPGSEHDRKKGVPWTEEEHKLFLMGLKKYGKGDWRNISRNFVITRTPTQVASHAQKYFIRQLSRAKDKRRASIHDITTMSINDDQIPSLYHKNPTLIDQSYDILTKSTAVQKLPFQLNNETTMGFHSSSVGNAYGLPGYGVSLYGLNEPTSRASQHMAFQVGSGIHYLNA